VEHTDEQINDLTEKVIGCAIEVHRVMGPGLLESIYQGCFVIALEAANLTVEASGGCVSNTKDGLRQTISPSTCS
jgi:GxxExxY protein